MRTIGVLTVSALFLLAGCSTSSMPSILTIGECEKSNDADMGYNSTIYECANVLGAGQFSMTSDCDFFGLVGVEEDDLAEGNITITMAASNGTFWSKTIGPGQEAWSEFDQSNGTITMRVTTSSNFKGNMTMGMACYTWDS